MKWIFMIFVFLLMLGVAAAQQSTNDLPDATNAIASTSFEKIKADAENGDVQSQLKLGMAYYYGNGVSKDYGEAAKWLLKVEAASVNPMVELCLFTCYLNKGIQNGVQRDINEGIKWLQTSAQNGNIDAQVLLGKAYAQILFGTKLGDFDVWGLKQNYAEAVKWFRRAANQGDTASQGTLGSCYFDGLGVPKNRVEAYKWFNLAATKDLVGAAALRDSLVGEMTSEEIAEAQQLSSIFVPKKEKPSSSSGSFASLKNPTASGSGFFITDDGYLISNYHVVKGATKVRLVTSIGTIDAKVVQVDAANDLALLKADGKFSPLPIAASRSVHLGGTVATIGFPNIGLQGFAPKLAKGEIASLSGAGDDPRYFQISVPVQPGNSGGALVDERGNVIGIVSAKLDASAALAASGSLPENVNYAVKSSLLLSFLESVPDVANKLKAPNTADEKFEEVVKSAQAAAVLVLVY